MRCASCPTRDENSEHQDGDRQQRRAGRDRRVAERHLQVQDDEEHRAAERRVHGERREVRARELAPTGRGRAAASAARPRCSIARTPTSATTPTAPIATAGHRPRPAFDQRVRHAGEADRHRDGAGARPDVSPRGRASRADGGARDTIATAASGRLMRKMSRHDTASISQPPTKGPIALGDAGESGPRADRPSAVVRVEGRRDDREAPGDEERAGRALQRTGGDERAGVRRDAAQQRRDDEAGEPARRRRGGGRATSPSVAAEQQERAEGDEVGVERPLQSRDGQPEVVARSPGARR